MDYAKERGNLINSSMQIQAQFDSIVGKNNLNDKEALTLLIAINNEIRTHLRDIEDHFNRVFKTKLYVDVKYKIEEQDPLSIEDLTEELIQDTLRDTPLNSVNDPTKLDILTKPVTKEMSNFVQDMIDFHFALGESRGSKPTQYYILQLEGTAFQKSLSTLNKHVRNKILNI